MWQVQAMYGIEPEMNVLLQRAIQLCMTNVVGRSTGEECPAYVDDFHYVYIELRRAEKYLDMCRWAVYRYMCGYLSGLARLPTILRMTLKSVVSTAHKVIQTEVYETEADDRSGNSPKLRENTEDIRNAVLGIWVILTLILGWQEDLCRLWGLPGGAETAHAVRGIHQSKKEEKNPVKTNEGKRSERKGKRKREGVYKNMKIIAIPNGRKGKTTHFCFLFLAGIVRDGIPRDRSTVYGR